VLVFDDDDGVLIAVRVHPVWYRYAAISFPGSTSKRTQLARSTPDPLSSTTVPRGSHGAAVALAVAAAVTRAWMDAWPRHWTADVCVSTHCDVQSDVCWTANRQPWRLAKRLATSWPRDGKELAKSLLRACRGGRPRAGQELALSCRGGWSRAGQELAKKDWPGPSLGIWRQTCSS
jgi:hypothetical protein